MGKLTILANPAIENQVLAIELAELILYWERKAKDSKEESQATQEDENIEEDKEEATATTTTAADEVRPEEISPLLQTIQFHLVKEACVTFLIRYVCISPQRASESELGQKALGFYMTC